MNELYQDAQAFSFLVGNTYSEDQITSIFMDNFHQGRKYSSQIASHQAELRIEEKSLIKIFTYFILTD